MKKLLILLIFVLAFQSNIAQSGNSTVTNETVLPKTQKVKIFPNPVTNVVNVLGLINSVQANILIIDINGGVVLQRKWAIRNKAVSIPVPNLNSGIYVIRIKSPEQQVQAKFYKN